LTKYILNRIALSLLILLVIMVITFFISRVLPGDPILLWTGDHPTEKQINQARKELGLDKTLFNQLINYSTQLLNGDMGVSIRTHQSVNLELKKRFFATFELVSISIFISIIIGYPLGLYAGLNKGKLTDKLISGFGYLGLSFPVFWLGMILQIIFFSQLNILPLQGRVSNYIELNNTFSGIILLDSLINQNWSLFLDAINHIILPAATLSFSIIGIVIRTTRSSLIDTMHEPYFNTFLTYGFTKREVVSKTAYKNTFIPVSTIVGLCYGLLLGGTFLVESIFDWPGLGQFCVLSILTNDFPAIIGVTLLYATSYILINFFIDVLYVFLDPRIEK
tara:strand:- start:2601 stop:3605 length:1005 start_codon:yes stop_codon:yes gene_type:complete